MECTLDLLWSNLGAAGEAGLPICQDTGMACVFVELGTDAHSLCEYKLLKALIENAGNILTRQTLLERLWDIEGNFVDDHALTATINRLQTKKEKLYANGSSLHIEFSYYFCF